MAPKPYRPLTPLAPRKKVKAIPVKSSTVASHTYDPEKQHLTISFHSGTRYRYAGVDQGTADRFTKAPSKGTFLHAHVIPHHRATKL